MLEGCDCSNNQGHIDWAAVAASGRRFAFVKATEGVGFHDAYFPANWAALAANELWRGCYHFARPGDAGTGADEANYFCDYVLSAPQLQGDMYVLDLETAPAHADLGAYVTDWCQTVENRTGVKPLIYSTVYMLKGWQVDPGPYPLWLASWGQVWPTWGGERSPFWQYADNGHVPGVQGLCDLDRCSGTEEDLAAYGVQG